MEQHRSIHQTQWQVQGQLDASTDLKYLFGFSITVPGDKDTSPVPTERKIPYVDWGRYHTKKTVGIIGAERDIPITKLIDQSLIQKPCYEITGEITDPVEKEELVNLLSNSSISNES